VTDVGQTVGVVNWCSYVKSHFGLTLRTMFLPLRLSQRSLRLCG
jgi:hypothetical protein